MLFKKTERRGGAITWRVQEGGRAAQLLATRLRSEGRQTERNGFQEEHKWAYGKPLDATSARTAVLNFNDF